MLRILFNGFIMKSKFLFSIILIHFVSLYSQVDGEGSEIKYCKPPWDIDKLSSCVIENHPTYRMESLRLKEIQGRKKISTYYFPSNPNVSSYVSSRTASEPGSFLSTFPSHASNFQLMVTQEIFIGGKREKAIQIADEEFRTQVFRLESVRRNIHFQGLTSVVKFLNFQKAEDVSFNLYLLAQDLTKLAKARVKEGIAPGMDESLAESEEIRMAKIWKLAKRKQEQARGEVYLLLSLSFEEEWTWNPSIRVNIDIPKAEDEIFLLALRNRPEINMSEKEIKIALLRLEEVKMQKSPNVSLGAFVQNDGFNERVVGGQVSLPLTIWRDYEGESLVAKAKGEQAFESKEILTRTIKQEVITAISNYIHLKEEFSFYDDALLDRSDSDLGHIQDALRLGKIKVIDAINNQRILVQTRLNYIQTKTEYDQAQIELIRALGLPTDQLIIEEKI